MCTSVTWSLLALSLVVRLASASAGLKETKWIGLSEQDRQKAIDRCISRGYPFTCYDGSYCVRNGRCDGSGDCHDSSDETGCPSGERGEKQRKSIVPREGNHETAVDLCTSRGYDFTCFDNTYCLNHAVCDGERDCDDASDESDCRSDENGNATASDAKEVSRIGLPRTDADHADAVVYCTTHGFNFTCFDDSYCVNNARCDGERDCVDGSDEYGCSGGKTATTAHGTSTTPVPSVDHSFNPVWIYIGITLGVVVIVLATILAIVVYKYRRNSSLRGCCRSRNAHGNDYVFVKPRIRPCPCCHDESSDNHAVHETLVLTTENS